MLTWFSNMITSNYYYFLLPALYGISRYQFKYVDPVMQVYRRCDPTINKPFIYPLTIAFWHILGMTSIIPTILIATSEHLWKSTEQSTSSTVLEYSAAKFVFGWLIAGLFVTYVKHTVGRLRPNFLAANRIEFDSNDHEWHETTLQEHARVCGKMLARESRFSFFSGHAILGMYAAAYMILYLQVKLLGYHSLVTHILQFCILLLGIYPGVTQARTYWHHPTDVAVGHLSGCVCAYLVFFYVRV